MSETENLIYICWLWLCLFFTFNKHTFLVCANYCGGLLWPHMSDLFLAPMFWLDRIQFCVSIFVVFFHQILCSFASFYDHLRRLERRCRTFGSASYVWMIGPAHLLLRCKLLQTLLLVNCVLYFTIFIEELLVLLTSARQSWASKVIIH